ncbi:hypothetical protein POM88_045490 [Heracleum sosnowskyi]|uniref:Uncharacterized protein n=1 Tax=Heracleum sosnowskyi TaxID=360622 RepID=A0AAD8H726_9APIA|nr:hypothetical protein POM88_045490 [Heracleum sosnowskyi]
MVTGLSEQQIQWVRRTGFGPILDFRLEKIPHKLTFNVLEAFDEDTCSLKLHSESITITNEDVYNVLGLPIGNQILIETTTDEVLKRQNLWKDQFGKTNFTTAAMIEKKKKQSDEADELFKLNFLMVLCNVLIERQTGSYVHREILSFNIQLDEWPIIFLIIFYVNRVTIKDLELVERQISAFKGWTVELLKKRQNSEQFGNGLVIEQRPSQTGEVGNEEHKSNHKVGGQDGNEAEETNIEDSRMRNGEHAHEAEDWFDILSMKAAMLMDAVEQYGSQLQIAKDEHPNDNDIVEIEGKIANVIKKLNAKK